ncbi:DNA-directed RNA polymerase subunit D [Candidatus Micrarchaeota archaeon]|jgi:DNA-directed RNA polymerase subunit D|nr:DNA-directed RNA polymerase subunit D [Candidatus Micrarchaeota archaeon]
MVIKIKVDIEDEKVLKLKVEDLEVGTLNSIRRYIIGQVPTFAIDSITIYDNSTYMFDEFIAHRIGQIPLKTPKKYKGDEEVLFTLDEKGPKEIKASDLRTSDKYVQPAKPDIHVFTLGEGQDLRLEGKAVINKGRKHAKFQSGIAAYEINKDGTYEFIVESFSQMSPRDVLLKAVEFLKQDVKEFEKQLK